MALLGKISAVITANATDFTRTIGTVKAELNALNKRVQGYRLNLDTAALDKTLTKLQLFRRTLQEALGKKIDTGPLQDLYKVFEDIGKPLTKVKGQIESLSNSTQAYLYPALEKAQKGFQDLYREIQAGTTTFDAAKGRIEGLARQIERLKASTAVVSEFSRLTGNLSIEGVGGTFVQPKAIAELQRFIELRKQATELSPAAREDPFFQGIVRDASVAAERIEAIVAKIERAKLRGASAESVIARAAARGRPAPAAALAAAAAAADDQRRSQEQLDREVERQGIRNSRIGSINALKKVGDMRAPEKAPAELEAAQKAAAAINALRAADPNLEPYAEELRQMAAAAALAATDVDRLALALQLAAKADAGSRLAASTSAINKISADARKGVDSLKTDSERRREVLREAAAAGVPKDEITGARRRAYLDNEIGGRVSSLQKTIGGLDSGLAGDLQRRLDASKASLDRLVNTKTTPLQTDINRLRREVEGLERDSRAAARAQRQLNEFDSSTAMNLQPRAVRDYINDFQLLLNLAGNLNEEAGTRFGGALDRSRARVRALAEQIAQIRLGPATEASAAQVEELLRRIRAESRSLAAELAGLDPSRFSERQLNRLLSANRRLRGDIAGMRGSAMAGQLALQQLTFAVDDFFSSTGGIEYKLRAISNNISQFGFILGGTYGLIAGVVATVGAQLLLQFGGIGKASKETEGSLKFMNEELERSRNLAEQNTKAFQDMAKALREAASGPRGDVERRIKEFRDEQKKSREADVLGRSVEARRIAGEIAATEDRLANANPADAPALRDRLKSLREQQKQVNREATAPRSLEQVRAALESARVVELRELEGRSNLLVASEETRRSERLRQLRSERIATPASASQAAEQVRARRDELIRTRDGADFVEKAFARALSSFGIDTQEESRFIPFASNGVRGVQELDKQINSLDEELARLEAIIREGADNLAAQFAEQALVAKEEISGVLQGLSSLNIDADIRDGLRSQLDAGAKALADAAQKIEEALKENPEADVSKLEADARNAADALEKLYRQADKLTRDVALGAFVPTANRLSAAASLADSVGGPTIAGSNATRYLADLRDREAKRDRAALRGDDKAVEALNREIEAIRLVTVALEQAAIAVVAFQRAAEEAAIALSKTLVEEARSEAERLRRRANRFAGDPDLGAGTAADRAAAEQRRREQEDFDRQLQRDIEREQLKFEREKAGTGRVGQLAREVREGRAAQADKSKTAEEQLAGKQRADEAQAQLDRELRARLQPFRDRADARDTAEAQRRDAANRANEETLSRTNFSRDLLGDNTQIARRIGGGAVGAAVALQKAMEEARRKIDQAAADGVEIPDALKAELENLAKQIADQRKQFVDELVKQSKARGSGFDAQSNRAREELNRSGVFASDIQGRLTELTVRRQALESERDAAIKENRQDEAEAIQKDIDAMNAMAEELNRAAIAVAAFQQAANKAALDLQRKIESESQGAADSARRRANEAEAVFGAGSPQAREARAEQRRREDAARAAEDENARAREAIAAERVKFEQEIANGQNPQAAARAEEIRKQEEIAADESRSAADREAARARADRLRREQEREFESRPEVQNERRRADDADARRAAQDSAARGRELMKTERQKAEEALQASAGDIGNAVRQMRREGVGRNQIEANVQNAANNLARQAAPMLAGFAEEVMNARLAGPSRAALNVSDVQTTEGARELNRLLRGDDASKDVNLVELRKQVQLLEAIEQAIRQQTNVVVDL